MTVRIEKSGAVWTVIHSRPEVRNAMDPAEAYRLFRGRDAQTDALMRARGFPVPE